MAENDIQDAIRSLVNSNPNLDPAILDQIANLYNPKTGNVEAGSQEVMTEAELDNVVGGAYSSPYKTAVLSLSRNASLNKNVISQIANLNIRACW